MIYPFTQSPPSKTNNNNDKEASGKNKICVSCTAANFHERALLKIYNGKPLTDAAFEENATFSNPFFSSQGLPQLQAIQAHRQKFNQELLPEDIELVGEDPSNRETTFAVSDMWPRGGFTTLLVVRTAEDGRISSVEERWNGQLLLSWCGFEWVRKGNGLLGWALAPILSQKN